MVRHHVTQKNPTKQQFHRDVLSSTWSEIFKIVLVSCLRNEAILARVVEFDTFTLSAQEPLGWSEVLGGVDGGGGFLFRDGVLGGGGVGFVWGKVGFSLGLVWGGRGVVCGGFLVLLVLNRTTYLKISKIRRWSEELWLRQHCSLSL
jgi:hypothetical protein